MQYEIIRHETKKYFYIWDNETGAQLCDLDGEPLRFETREQAAEYIEDLEA